MYFCYIGIPNVELQEQPVSFRSSLYSIAIRIILKFKRTDIPSGIFWENVKLYYSNVIL